MVLEVGSRLGHYNVTALIGEGGMGQVYRATDPTRVEESLVKRAVGLRWSLCLATTCLVVAIVTACGEDLGWRGYSAAGLEAVARGDLAEAEALLEAAVADAERYGPNDFRVAITLNILAGFYRTVERYAEAEPLYQRALAVAEERWGPDHPRVAMVLESYAFLLGQTGRRDDAAVMAERAAGIRQSTN